MSEVSPNKGKNKSESKEKEQRRSCPAPYSSSTDAMKEGVGRNNGGSSPAPGSSASALLSSSRSLRSMRSHSDTSLPASSPAGTSLPTSVVESKSNTAWLHLPSARRSQVFVPALPPPAFLPHLCPQNSLLLLPLRAHLEEVVPRLRWVLAPPALCCKSVLRPLEVLPGETVASLHLVEP